MFVFPFFENTKPKIMSEFYKKKRMARMIGWGAVIIIPLVFVLSYFFNELKMSSVLSIFLIVLISSVALFGYYLLFSYIENKKLAKRNNTEDPFNK